MINWPDIIKLALPLLCIFGIVWLFLHYSKNFQAEKPRANLLYICGYGLLLIIELIVYISLNNFQSSDIINTVSFGATLSSLIMSVVAIIFTIVSGKHGEEQLGKITQATTELQQTARSLTEFNALADTIIGSLVPKLEVLEQKIEENVEHTKAIHSRTDEIREEQLNTKNAASSKSAPQATISGNTLALNAKDITSSGSFLGAVVLLACCYSKDKDKTWKVSEMGSAFKQSNIPYIQAYLIATSVCGVINYLGQAPDISVSSYIDGLKEGAEDKIKTFITNEDNHDFREELIKEVHSLQSYFSVPLTNF